MWSIPFVAPSVPASGDPIPGRWPTLPIVALIVAASTVLIATASLPSYQILGSILAFGGLVLVIRWRDTPVVTLAIVMFLALSSRPTVEIASVNIRVEQPSILFLAGYMLVTSRELLEQLVRRYWLLVLGLVTWLAAAAAASAFVAPEPGASLRIVIWLGISFIAGGVGAVLAARAARHEAVIGAILLAATVHVGIVVLAAASGRLLGVDWGGYVRSGTDYGFRATGLAWEANIFASGTAIAIPLAISRYLGSGRRVDLAVIGVLGLGVWLALTRTVFAALSLGVIIYLGLLLWRDRARVRRWLPRFAIATLALVVGVGSGALVNVATSSVRPGPLAERNSERGVAVLPAPPTSALGTAKIPSTPAPGPTESYASPSRSPSGLLPVDLGDTSNVEFRLVRLRQSLADLPASPWIGLGANSFGQRHADPSQSFRSDYLGMLPFTILYDAGLIGLAGFLLFVAGTVAHLLRWRVAPVALAFTVSLAIMLMSYLMTDALRFASNWILIGAAVGLAYRWPAWREA